LTDHPVVPVNFLVHQASFAVKEGLDPVVALEALTVNPASFLGLDDRVGSIAPGLDADVVIWSGDPLDITSVAERVYIGGRLQFEVVDGTPVVADRFFPAAR
jgi:imidazolonepropionase-like amidohydrolase